MCKEQPSKSHLSPTRLTPLHLPERIAFPLAPPAVVAKGFFDHPKTGEPPQIAARKVAIFSLGNNSDAGVPSVESVLSLTDIVRFLHERSADLGSLRDATVSDFGLAARMDEGPSLATVPDTTLAIEAFATMASRKVSAIAVLSAADGALVGVLSATDVRGIAGHHGWGRLALPVLEFLALERRAAGGRRSVQTPAAALEAQREALRSAVVTAKPSTTVPEARGGGWLAASSALAFPLSNTAPPFTRSLPPYPCCCSRTQVISLFVLHHVHHVFVVGEGGRPMSVITPTDVLQVCGRTASPRGAKSQRARMRCCTRGAAAASYHSCFDACVPWLLLVACFVAFRCR